MDQEKRKTVQHLTEVLVRIGSSHPEFAEACNSGSSYLILRDMFDEFGRPDEDKVEEHLLDAGEDDGEDYIDCVVPILSSIDHAGFRFLGAGYFASVWAHSAAPGVAFKLSARPVDAYYAYALFCRQNPSKYRPHILAIEREGDYAAFAMPKYISVQADMHLGAEFVLAEHGEDHKGVFMAYVRAAAYALTGHSSYRGCANSVPPSLQEAALDLALTMEYFGDSATIDVHEDNFMYDPVNDCVVVTDPVSFTRTTEGDTKW